MYEVDIFSIDKNDNLIVTTTLSHNSDDSELTKNNIIYEFVKTLPNISEFIRVRNDEGIFTDWDEYAKKGITAYDDYDAKNILTSKSLTPLKFKYLPENIKKIFQK